MSFEAATRIGMSFEAARRIGMSSEAVPRRGMALIMGGILKRSLGMVSKRTTARRRLQAL
jgi:hypothetical protein